MQRRDFILNTIASLTVTSLGLAGCSTSATATKTTSDTGSSAEKKRREIDAGVDSTLSRLYSTAKGSRELVAKASGVLVFPDVIQAGFVIGGQYGEGALRVGGAPAGYYSLSSISAGLQAGAQSKAVIFLFMTRDALNGFRSSSGWVAGGEASVAILKVGASGNVEVGPSGASVLAFVLTNVGLMANLSLEGTKITNLTL